MAQNVQMLPTNTINGSFGELYLDGRFMAQAKGVKAKITIDKEEIQLSSTRRTGYKAKGVKGDGTLTLYKVTSEMLERISSYMSNGRSVMPVFSRLVIQLDDPESLGVERVALKGVKFWEIEFGFELDKIMEEEIPFTFDSIEFEQKIVGDPTRAR